MDVTSSQYFSQEIKSSIALNRRSKRKNKNVFLRFCGYHFFLFLGSVSCINGIYYFRSYNVTNYNIINDILYGEWKRTTKPTWKPKPLTLWPYFWFKRCKKMYLKIKATWFAYGHFMKCLNKYFKNRELKPKSEPTSIIFWRSFK